MAGIYTLADFFPLLLVRVEIFRHFVNNDFNRTFQQGDRYYVAGLIFILWLTCGPYRSEPISIRRMFDMSFNRPLKKRATIRRSHIAQDGFDQLSDLGSELKGPVEIQFIDQFGQEEYVYVSVKIVVLKTGDLGLG